MSVLAAVALLFLQAPQAPATVRVEGRVVDSLGDAVPMAVVVAATPRGGVEVARVQADGDGAFVLPRLQRQDLTLRATAARRIGQPQRLRLDERPWCEVAALPVLLRMHDAVTVRGCVEDENGKPIARARVLGQREGEQAPWGMAGPFVETDALGRFETPVPFGRVLVCAFAANREVAVERVTLVADHELDFVLRNCPSCELRIHYRGATARDLDWMAFCDDGDFEPDLWQSWPQTRKDEAVVFHGLPAGSGLAKFRLYFVPHGIENTDYVVPATPGPHTIEAPTGPGVKPDAPLVELRGRLVDTAGKPIDAARLTRWVSSEHVDAVRTDADGRFHVSLRSRFWHGTRNPLPSEWVGLDGDDYVPVSPRVERHAGDYALDLFDLPTAGNQELVLVAARAAAITGRLLDAAKQPVRGALVQIRTGEGDHDSDSSVCTLTDRDGRFALRGLRASSRFKLWLRATWPDGELATEQLKLHAGETLALGDLEAGKPNVIEGELAGGEQTAGAPLTLIRGATTRAYERWRHSSTDRLGRFRFTGLPEGDYTIHTGDFPGRGAEWPVVGKATVTHGERVAIGGR